MPNYFDIVLFIGFFNLSKQQFPKLQEVVIKLLPKYRLLVLFIGLMFFTGVTPYVSSEKLVEFPVEQSGDEERGHKTMVEEIGKDDEVLSSVPTATLSQKPDLFSAPLTESGSGVVKQIPTPPPRTT